MISLMSKQAACELSIQYSMKRTERFNIFLKTEKLRLQRMILKTSILIVVVGIIVYYAYEWARSKLLRIQKLEFQLSQFVSPHPQDVKEDPSKLISCPVSETRRAKIKCNQTLNTIFFTQYSCAVPRLLTFLVISV